MQGYRIMIHFRYFYEIRHSLCSIDYEFAIQNIAWFKDISNLTQLLSYQIMIRNNTCDQQTIHITYIHMKGNKMVIKRGRCIESNVQSEKYLKHVNKGFACNTCIHEGNIFRFFLHFHFHGNSQKIKFILTT